MVSKREILELLEELGEWGNSLGAHELARRFRLSEDDAARRLERMWREQLIEPTRPRPFRSRFRRQPGERVQDMKFRLTDRGRERLEWYRGLDETEEGRADSGSIVFE